MSQGKFLAKALYDNAAETPDELTFRRGEVLVVLEQDTKGLDGWWLCTLRGKQGIAPGNRLKIVTGMGDVSLGGDASLKKMTSPHNSGVQDYDVPRSNKSALDVHSPARRPSYDNFKRISPGSQSFPSVGEDLYDAPASNRVDHDTSIYDTPPSSKRASCERTPPHSNRSSASRDSGPTLAPSLSHSQLSLHLQPGAGGGGGLGLPTVLKHRRGSYNTDGSQETPPGSNRSSLDRILSEEGPPIYETLSAANSTEHLDADPTYDTPPVRSHPLVKPMSQSSLALAGSSESLLSNTSNAASLPDSARSSMDLPSEIYDVPPAANSESGRSHKQLSVDSGLGFYDSPARSQPSSLNSQSSTLENFRSGQFDFKTLSSQKDIKRSKSLENAIDDVYDTPKNNAPKAVQKKIGGMVSSSSSSALLDSASVYDVPPQVTRDSVISMRSDSSDDNQRFSSSSLDNEQRFTEVLLYDELFLDVDSALDILVKKQQDVFKAIGRLAGFVNSSWRSQSSLEKTLCEIRVSCTSVRNSLSEFVKFSRGAIANAVRLPDRQLASKIQKYLSPLENILDLISKSLANLEEMKWQVSLLSEPLDRSRPDDLGQLALVAKELMPEVKRVASLIQSNGSILFRKCSTDGKRLPVSSKPPIIPKLGDSNGGKVSNVDQAKPKTMLHRPLPAVPANDRCLPATIIQALVDKQKVAPYEVKATLNQDDYEECDDLPVDIVPQQARMEILDSCGQEYDYVQLDSRKNVTMSSSAVGQTGDLDNNIHSVYNNSKVKSAFKNSSRSEDSEQVPLQEQTINSIRHTKNSTEENNITENCPTSSEEAADLDVSEQDLKTPVNVNSPSLEESRFIMPLLNASHVINESNSLDPNDRQVLVYYSEQVIAHSTLLSNAIDAFIAVVGNKEPPNIFISHSKFVIVSAHKLVHIGDSIHRNLISNAVSLRVMQCANQLCDCLKSSVKATKTAALNYPSAPAIQEMVDKVIAVSHAAHELKLIIIQAAKQ